LCEVPSLHGPTSIGAAAVPTSIQRESELPPYRQLYAILRDEILAGQIPPAHPIPSLAELELAYRLSRTTCRKAVALLARDGLVTIVQGWRTTVRDPEHWRI
jgi:DNA-binding GntR family transcriptional regulator